LLLFTLLHLDAGDDRSETENFMEVEQGPNWGCSAKGKKKILEMDTSFSETLTSIYKTIRCNTPRDRNLNKHRRVDLNIIDVVYA
jgi:hypothetical protein